MPENPCNPVDDCACLQANANYWQAAYIIDTGLASYYNGLASSDMGSYYQFMMWMYQYGCGMMRALLGKPEQVKLPAPEPLTDEQQKELETDAEEFRKGQIDKLIKFRAQAAS